MTALWRKGGFIGPFHAEGMIQIVLYRKRQIVSLERPLCRLSIERRFTHCSPIFHIMSLWTSLTMHPQICRRLVTGSDGHRLARFTTARTPDAVLTFPAASSLTITNVFSLPLSYFDNAFRLFRLWHESGRES